MFFASFTWMASTCFMLGYWTMKTEPQLWVCCRVWTNENPRCHISTESRHGHCLPRVDGSIARRHFWLHCLVSSWKVPRWRLWRHLACHISVEGDDWLCSWNCFLIVLQDSDIFWQPEVWYILTTSSLLYHTRKSDGESIQRAFPRCLYVAFIQEPTQSLRFLAFSGTVVLLCSCWNSLAVPKFQKVRFSHLLATDHELEAQARQAVQVLFTASSAMSNVMSSNLQHPLPRRHKHSQAIYEGWSALGNRSLNPSCVHGRIKQISPFNHAVFWYTMICSNMFQASSADFLCESFSGAFVDKSALEFQRFGNALIKFVKLHWLVLVLLHETPWKQHANTIPSNCSQVLCGALPVGYLKAVKANEWATFARVDA